MTYEEIRAEIEKEKKSHFHRHMEVIKFDHFSICKSEKAGAIIVDSIDADIIAKRMWCEDSHGYIVARVAGELVRLHDFVMALHHEKKPDGMYIDHVNCDKKDNRYINLRFVTPAENTLNLSLRSTNKSGVTGVCRAKNGRYRAYIKYAGKQVNLGYYKTLEEAKHARIEGERRFGYKPKAKNVAELCNLAFLAELEGKG